MSVGSDSSQLTDEVLLISRPSGSEYCQEKKGVAGYQGQSYQKI